MNQIFFYQIIGLLRLLEYLLLLFVTLVKNADWEYRKTETNQDGEEMATTIFRSLLDYDRLLGIIIPIEALSFG